MGLLGELLANAQHAYCNSPTAPQQHNATAEPDLHVRQRRSIRLCAHLFHLRLFEDRHPSGAAATEATGGGLVWQVGRRLAVQAMGARLLQALYCSFCTNFTTCPTTSTCLITPPAKQPISHTRRTRASAPPPPAASARPQGSSQAWTCPLRWVPPAPPARPAGCTQLNQRSIVFKPRVEWPRLHRHAMQACMPTRKDRPQPSHKLFKREGRTCSTQRVTPVSTGWLRR